MSESLQSLPITRVLKNHFTTRQSLWLLSDVRAVGNVSEPDNGWRTWNQNWFTGVWAFGDGITVGYTLGMSRLGRSTGCSSGWEDIVVAEEQEISYSSRGCFFTVGLPRLWFTVMFHVSHVIVHAMMYCEIHARMGKECAMVAAPNDHGVTHAPWSYLCPWHCVTQMGINPSRVPNQNGVKGI